MGCGTVAGAPGSIRRAPRTARAAQGNRAYKERLVREGKAHAALVFDSDVAVAWCEYGSPNALPNIYHPKEYNAGLDKGPDYRLRCFLVDRNYRRKGVAAVALRGALEVQAVAGPSSSVNERRSRALGSIPKLLARGGSKMREPGGLDHAAPPWTVADACTVSDRDGPSAEASADLGPPTDQKKLRFESSAAVTTRDGRRSVAAGFADGPTWRLSESWCICVWLVQT